MKIIIFLLPVCFALPAANEINAKCAEENKLISLGDKDKCDAYIECKNGEATEKTCPEGLVFEEKVQKCVFPQFASCKNISIDKSEDPDCPYKNGMFFSGNESSCGTYTVCDDEIPTQKICENNLAFNEASGQCDWPDQVGMCKPELFYNITCDSVKRKSYKYLKHTDENKHFDCTSGSPRLIQSSIPLEPKQ